MKRKQRTLSQYLKAPLDKDVLEFLRESNNIEREYGETAFTDAVEAWRYAVKNCKNITLKYVLKIHGLLMENIGPAIAGKVRDCDVYIGQQHKMFINKALIEDDIKALVDVMNNDLKAMRSEPDIKKEEKAKALHVWFESIHPFVDGNGRTGRILYNIHRLKAGLPLHIIHTGYDQWEYYKWFNNSYTNPHKGPCKKCEERK